MLSLKQRLVAHQAFDAALLALGLVGQIPAGQPHDRAALLTAIYRLARWRHDLAPEPAHTKRCWREECVERLHRGGRICAAGHEQPAH